MGDMTVRSQGGDRYVIEIGDHALLVDQPIDGGGTDEGPTPTELFVASLASCSAFYAGRFLARHGIDGEVTVHCAFAFAEDRPARVGRIDLTLDVPPGLSPDAYDRLRAVVEHCTVKNSLAAPPEVALELRPAVAAA